MKMVSIRLTYKNLTLRKDLLQCFEIMTTSEMGKATITVDYNYY